MDQLLGLVPARYLGIVTATMVLCGAIVAAVPAPVNPTSAIGKLWLFVWTVLDKLSLGFGHATTANAALNSGAVVTTEQALNGVIKATAAASGTGSIIAGKIVVLLLGFSLCSVLGACSTAQTASIEKALGTPAGQLFCSVESAAGPIIFAALDAASGGSAVIATGATAAYVAAACAAAVVPGALVGSVPTPVSPPAGTVPSIAVVVPATTG